MQDQPPHNSYAEEAADLFLRLRNDPENADFLAERDAFLERGEMERKAYAAVRVAWAQVPEKTSNKKTKIILAAAFLGTSGYFAADPITVALIADHSTRYETEVVTLDAGDIVSLDATSALVDASDEAVRQYELMSGAAFFDVGTQDRPFSVSLDNMQVLVTGTQFETLYLENGLQVSVTKGSVEVRIEDDVWALTPGMRLTWSGASGPQLSNVAPEAIALWREDRLVTNGMRFDEVVDVIARRTRGTVFVPNADLSAQIVSGVIDLSEPQLALRTLAASQGARVFQAGPLATFVLPSR